MWSRVAKDSFRAINYKRGKRSDKSVFIPKLSALEHRCLRFLLLIKMDMIIVDWYDIDFFSKEANHRRAQITKASTRGWRICKATVRSAKVPVQPTTRYLYLYLLVYSPVLSLLDPSLFSLPLLLITWSPLPERRPLSWCLLSLSCCSVTITTFSLLDCQQLASPSPPVTL